MLVLIAVRGQLLFVIECLGLVVGIAIDLGGTVVPRLRLDLVLLLASKRVFFPAVRVLHFGLD